ncbi:hypothetical protein AURDEDRAFT_174785 [Auricularia subglabra TFB-10046 SS5]|uniref:Uncharacterized protein n=1 Tax=Auricularia subglabra (strain TFB-10046 / SS5) TaxID=717982 RepID=J0LFP4_AURST|nr:hypothetical protein AURDEDRAFT_174785 [Auricularia subglabra TFB-10046 SS5]
MGRPSPSGPPAVPLSHSTKRPQTELEATATLRPPFFVLPVLPPVLGCRLVVFFAPNAELILRTPPIPSELVAGRVPETFSFACYGVRAILPEGDGYENDDYQPSDVLRVKPHAQRATTFAGGHLFLVSSQAIRRAQARTVTTSSRHCPVQREPRSSQFACVLAPSRALRYSK